MNTEKSERIAKVIAHAGICSRREAETLISQGRVCVNGVVLSSPAFKVMGEDTILVDGNLLPPPDHPRLWLYHKPKGILTTSKDPQGRPTVFGSLPSSLPRVISVGRLDLNSEGLLLLTNKGFLAKFLMDPQNKVERVYRVRVHGHVTPRDVLPLQKGITVEGITYAPVRVHIDKKQGDNTWLTLTLTEGKNREIRCLMDFLGFPVTRLIRIAYGPFQLGTLAPWAVEEIPFERVDAFTHHIPRTPPPSIKP